MSVFNFRSFEWCYHYLSLLISKRNFYSNTTIRSKRKSLLNKEWNALIKNMSTTWTSFLFNDSVSAEITLEGTSRMIFFSALKLQSHKFITLSLFSRFPTTTLSLELKTTQVLISLLLLSGTILSVLRGPVQITTLLPCLHYHRNQFLHLPQISGNW